MALTLPSGVFRWRAPVLIGLLAAGSLATQALAILTGRDFAFGLIPKLNPGGAHNIPVWASSITFAMSACLAVAAAVTVPAGRKAAKGWWALAGILTILSAERMAFPNRGLQSVLLDLLGWDFVLALVSTFALLSVAVYVTCIRGLSRGTSDQLTVAGVVFLIGSVACAAAAYWDASTGVQQQAVYAVMMTAGRLLELAGLTLFVRSMIQYLRAHGYPVVITVDSASSGIVERGRSARALELRISPVRVRLLLVWTTALILIAGTAAAAALLYQWNVGTVHRFLNVDAEGNLPTWWSAILLLSCGVVTAAIAGARHHAGDVVWRRWQWLAILFVLLSLDEAASFHELLVLPLRAAVGQNPWLRYPLIIPGIIAVAAAFGFFRQFLSALPSAFRRSLFLGFGVFVLGALGVETAGGWYDPTVIGPNPRYIALATLEEGCEMLGVTLVFIGLLRYVECSLGSLKILPCNGPRPLGQATNR